MPPLCLCQWGRSDAWVYLRQAAFMPHLLHLRIMPLTFPVVLGALYVGAFNSLAISASIQVPCFICLDFPISWGLITNVLQQHHVIFWGVYERGRATSSNAITVIRDRLIATNIFFCPSQRPFPQLLIYTCLSLVLHCQETGAFLLIDMMQQGKKKVQQYMKTGGLQLNSL